MGEGLAKACGDDPWKEGKYVALRPSLNKARWGLDIQSGSEHTHMPKLNQSIHTQRPVGRQKSEVISSEREAGAVLVLLRSANRLTMASIANQSSHQSDTLVIRLAMNLRMVPTVDSAPVTPSTTYTSISIFRIILGHRKKERDKKGTRSRRRSRLSLFGLHRTRSRRKDKVTLQTRAVGNGREEGRWVGKAGHGCHLYQ